MIRRYITAIVATLLSIVGVVLYRKGKKDAYDADQLEELNEYIETRKRMEAADPGSDVDKWLRERAKRDGNL